ncbi:MAG: patatin family protein [Clostridia bacterium]|nr:patatin family protein [Clostridia bacterium]
MKKGLVMEGGGMRGLFTAGVIDVFMENGINFDGAVGVSAGAAFGCNIKSQQPGRVLRYNLAYCKDPRFCSVRSLLKTGDMFGAEFCYRTLPYELDKFDTAVYDANPMEFHVVCTDVETGLPVYKNCMKADENAMEWFRASASMPLVSRVVEADGYKMLDGGIADSIPIAYFRSIGYDKNVVILTQPKQYRKGKNKMLSLLKHTLRKYPKTVEAMAKRHLVYNETVDEICRMEEAGEILVIRPNDPLPIGRICHDGDTLKKAHELGRQAGMAALEKVRAFFEM